MITYEQWMEKVVKGKKRFIYTEDGFSGEPEAVRTSEAYYQISNEGKCFIERVDEEIGDSDSAEKYFLTEEELEESLAGCEDCTKKRRKK